MRHPLGNINKEYIMIITCPYCNKILERKDSMVGRKGRCPSCGNTFEASGIQDISDRLQPDDQTDGYNELRKGSFFSRIHAYLISPRKVLYNNSHDTLQIQYFWVPSNAIKNNWSNWITALFLIIGFGILPIALGFFRVLFELLQGNGEIGNMRGPMYFLLIFFLIPPCIVYKLLIMPIFTIRSIILDTYQIVIQDSFFGFKPKIKLAVPKQKVQKIKWQNTSLLEKMSQENEKLFLIHDKGKLEIISTYPEHDILRIQRILEKYLKEETIEEVQKESDHVQKSIEANENKVYSLNKLIFFHIIGKKDVAVAPLIKYLGVNAWIGAFGLFAVVMGIVMHVQGFADAIDNRYLIIQGISSFILFIGWPLNKLSKMSESMNRQLLSVGGLIIFSYSIYLIYSILPDIKGAIEAASNIRHSPGLLTFLTSYGFWLICEFGPLRFLYKKPLGHWLPRIVFIMVVMVDIYILYLFINTIITRMGNF
jgi:hypothetical protein